MELPPLMAEAFPELGVERQDCREVTYNEAIDFYAEFIVPGITPFKGISDFVRHSFPLSAYQGLWNLLKENAIGFMIMEPFGGKMGEIPFPHRRGNDWVSRNDGGSGEGRGGGWLWRGVGE